MTNTTRAEIAGGAPTGPTQALVLDLREVDRTRIGLVGGKGANLGELSRLAEVRVPAGVCVTTAAFRRMLAAAPAIAGPLERLAGLAAEDRAGIRELSDELRRIVEATELPADVEAALTRALTRLGAEEAYAVRSSATAEDLPGASFAGQQDTFLNVRGVAAIRAHVRRCWASLFSERAVAYRIQHGFDHREAHMAVVIQRMVFAQAAGVLFTADPVTSNRKVAAIEACFGLGEALVGGQASADRYAVRDARILERAIASKERAVDAAAAGGTEDRAIEPERRTAQVLTDAQIVRLAQLGRSIEAHFGQPQDIEWCLVDDAFHIVQSRPITTLYPIPEAHDGGNHVYLSVGHQQMMTDAMKPLGLSVRQMTLSGPMHAAGGRLFADATRQLASAASRDHFLNVLGRADPLVKDALTTLLARGDFLELAPAAAPTPGAPPRFGATVDDDPAVVGALIERSELELAELRREIQGKTGTALLECVRDDLDKLRRSLADPRNLEVIMAGMDAAGWLNEHLLAWLGEKNAADVLSQSLADNVTSRMGLDLLAVADVIRPWPDVVAYLERATGDDFLAGLAPLAGGPAARDAIQAFLDRYGMRCAGEIDITRPRWREQPASLIPVLLGNVKNCEPHAGERRFEQGRQAALTRARTLLERVRRLPDGESKADETRRMIDRLRNFSGYREYPKYAMVQRYFVHRQALLQEAGRLVQAGVIRDVEDIDYLTFDELREVVRTQSADLGLVDRRRAAHALHERLSPPRVITSEGEVLAGAFRRDGLPAGALVGLAVSSGVVEGRARVVLDMAAADLQAGDILVTTFTDPSWTPLFVAIRGLVTEVGGLMTHGAVIAREYGLPAVVSVAHATRRIRDGQRIRVNGSDGYVETLTE